MNIFDRFRSVLKKKTPTTAELAAAIEDARQAWETAKVAADRERDQHAKHLLAGSGEAAKHKQLIAELEDQARDAATFLTALEERHHVVAATEAEAARVARCDAAAKLAADVGEELVSKYPELVAGLLQLLHRVTLADAAIQEANADLPAGRERLQRVEAAVRDAPDVPRKVVREQVVSLWAYPNSERPLDEGQAAKVLSSGGDRGVIPGGQWSPGAGVVKRRFRRIEYLEGRGASSAPRLVDMDLPALRARDPALSTKGEFNRATPDQTLRRLEAVVSGERVWRADSQKVQIEYVPADKPADAEAG